MIDAASESTAVEDGPRPSEAVVLGPGVPARLDTSGLKVDAASLSGFEASFFRPLAELDWEGGTEGWDVQGVLPPIWGCSSVSLGMVGAGCGSGEGAGMWTSE